LYLLGRFETKKVTKRAQRKKGQAPRGLRKKRINTRFESR